MTARADLLRLKKGAILILATFAVADSFRIKTVSNITAPSSTTTVSSLFVTPSNPQIFVTPLPDVEQDKVTTTGAVPVVSAATAAVKKVSEYPPVLKPKQENDIRAQEKNQITLPRFRGRVTPSKSVVYSEVRTTSERGIIARNRRPLKANSHIKVQSTYGVSSTPITINQGNFGQKNGSNRSIRRKIASGRDTNITHIPENSSIRERSRGFKASVKSETIDDVLTLTTAPDVDVSQSETRPLVKPALTRRHPSAYHFETGKLNRTSTDSKTNEQNELQRDKQRRKVTAEDTNLPPKRFSSRYRGSRPGAPKTYARGNHHEVPLNITLEDNSNATATPNLHSSPRINKQNVSDVQGHVSLKPYDGPLEEAESVQRSPAGAVIVAEPSDEAAVPTEDKAESKKKEGGNTDVKKGGGSQHHSESHAQKGEKGEKDYKADHHFNKGNKGFHDKEAHQGEYLDEKGSKKSHKEGGGHFEQGHHEEKGEKDAGHTEKEEYKKGHSTRGGHVVHKKDEYEKKLEFFDESHEGGEGEKFGSFFESYAGKKGGHKKGGHKAGSSDSHHKGKKGKFMKGSQYHEDKGHDNKSGEDGAFKRGKKWGKEGHKKNSKKWNYAHGPAKSGGGGGKKQALQHIERRQDDAVEEEPKESEHLASVAEDKTDEEGQSQLKDGSLLEIVEDVEEVGETKAPSLTAEKSTSNARHFSPLVGKSRKYASEQPKKDEKLPNNAEYLDEDGPTSFYSSQAHKEKREREEKQKKDEDENVNEEVEDERDDADGIYLTEQELIEDKETEQGLSVLNHLHPQDYEVEDEEESPRSYRVAEVVNESQYIPISLKPPKWFTF